MSDEERRLREPDADASPSRPTRRGLFTVAGAAAAAGAAGWGIGRVSRTDAPGEAQQPPDASSTGEPTALPAAARRPGITFPSTPQRHALVQVFACEGVSSDDLLTRARDAVAHLPEQPADAGEVTVTFGFSPSRALELWPERAAASTELPGFASDAAEIVTGGDIAVQVCAETASSVHDLSVAVHSALGSPTTLWAQRGYRDTVPQTDTARTGIGFIDGIVVARGNDELEAGVWVDAQHHDTFVVLRRMHIGTDFEQKTPAEQERAIGRRRDSGAPLSGGEPHDDIDLFAKEPDGRLKVPASAHARRAHPSYIGRPLMLRRSYSVNLADGPGLLFIAFVSDPQTFVLTQRRLDEMDALIQQTSTDASGVFFVPGTL